MSKQFYSEMWHTIKHLKKPVEVVVLNKKKNGSTYKAKLQISPVFSGGVK